MTRHGSDLDFLRLCVVTLDLSAALFRTAALAGHASVLALALAETEPALGGGFFAEMLGGWVGGGLVRESARGC